MPSFVLRLGFASCLGLLVGCEALQQIQISRAGAEYFMPKLEGFVESDHTTNGTRIDLEDTIALDDESVIVYRGSLSIAEVAFDVRYFDARYSDSTTLTETVTLAANTFAPGTAVKSELDLRFLDVRSKFPVTAFGPVIVQGVIGIEWVQNEIEIASGTTVSDEGFDQWFPTAGLGGEFRMPLGEDFGFFVDGDVAILGWDFFDVEGFFLDGSIRGGVQFSFLTVGGGYRYLDFDLEERSSDYEMDYTMQGPFVFGELVF